MARSRNIKPGFFKNYELADLGPVAQLLFAGLWCLADREGRLEDKPRLIKAELFPYYECDVNGELTELQRLGFVRRYSVNGVAVVEVLSFKKHQTPHNTEKASALPAFDESAPLEPAPILVNSESTVKDLESNDGKTPDSLIPDSLLLIPDSPIPDSLLSGKVAVATKPARKGKEPAPSSLAWNAYATAYADRYGAEPVRNAMVNGQLSQFIGRVGEGEAPAIAAWYVGHKHQRYVNAGHSVGLLLSDAEKLRTEWATNRAVTATQAMQGDKTQTNLNAFAPLIAKAQKEALDAQH